MTEQADAHMAGDCDETCPHPDHDIECVVDLSDFVPFDRFEPPLRPVWARATPEGAVWL